MGFPPSHPHTPPHHSCFRFSFHPDVSSGLSKSPPTPSPIPSASRVFQISGDGSQCGEGRGWPPTPPWKARLRRWSLLWGRSNGEDALLPPLPAAGIRNITLTWCKCWEGLHVSRTSCQVPAFLPDSSEGFQVPKSIASPSWQLGGKAERSHLQPLMWGFGFVVV